MGNTKGRHTARDGGRERPRSAKHAVIGLCLALIGALPGRAWAFDTGRFLATYIAQINLLIPERPDPQVKFLKYVNNSPYGDSEQPVYTVPEGHVVNFDCTMLVMARSGATIHTAPKDVFLLHYAVHIAPQPPESFVQTVDPEDVFGNSNHYAKRAIHGLQWRAHGGGDHQVVCEVTDPAGLATKTAILRVKPLAKIGDLQKGAAKTANAARNLPAPVRIGRPMQPGKAQISGAAATLAKSGWADLVITAATVRLSQHCAPNQPVLLASVTVRNMGKQAAPAKSGVGMVQARDTVIANWGNGTGTPALAPGKSAQLRFPIYYLRSNPVAMAGHHAFEFTVNAGHWVNEARTDNDRFGPVTVTIPAKFCAAGRALKRVSPRAVQTVNPKLNPQPEPPSATHRLSPPAVHR